MNLYKLLQFYSKQDIQENIVYMIKIQLFLSLQMKC